MTLRIEPIQARSTARLRALLDATAEVVGDVGIERVTTNLVADRAGSAIGTLYRYFPDRIAVLRGLALRHATSIHEDVQQAAGAVSKDAAGLGRMLEAVNERFIERYRSEPGWSAISFDHTLDVPIREGEEQLVSTPLRTERTPRSQIAVDAAAHFTADDELRRDLADDIEVVMVLTQQLVDRAFAASPEGDERLLTVARRASATAVELIVARFSERLAAA